jgi:hypothetical protein
MTEESPRKKGIQPEMLVGVSAVFIGVCGLVVSLYETSLMREEQRASVLPIVELGRSHYSKDECWKSDYTAGFAGSVPVPACERNKDSFTE